MFWLLLVPIFSSQNSTLSDTILSDHDALTFNKITTAKICERGVFKVYTLKRKDGSIRFCCCPVFKTTLNFRIAQEIYDDFTAKGLKNTASSLLEKADSGDIQNFNQQVDQWADEIKTRYGFDSYTMIPLEGKALLLPKFLQESENEQQQRIKELGKTLFENGSTLYFLQGITFDAKSKTSPTLRALLDDVGENDWVVLSPDIPDTKETSAEDVTCAVIVYSPEQYEPVPDKIINDIAQKIQTKLLSKFKGTTTCSARALRDKSTGKIRFFASGLFTEHTIENYALIQQLLETVPGFSIGGDFDLRIKNQKVTHSFIARGISVTFLQTLEKIKPTTACIFSGPDRDQAAINWQAVLDELDRLV